MRRLRPKPSCFASTKQGAGPVLQGSAIQLCTLLPACRRREDAKRRVVELGPAVGKWLKASGAADVAIGGIAWGKVLQPNKKVGLRLLASSGSDL